MSKKRPAETATTSIRCTSNSILPPDFGDEKSAAAVLKQLSGELAACKTEKDVTAVLHKVAGFILYSLQLTAVSSKKGDNAPSLTHYRVVEVELYTFLPEIYADNFTHGDPIQKTSGNFYFHKKGGSYKAGSFKGLDFTFGHESTIPGGALIRSIRRSDDPTGKSSVIEGPCLVVDELLKQCGSSDIKSLVGKKPEVEDRKGELHALRLDDTWDGRQLYCTISPIEESTRTAGTLLGPRVGLVPRVPSHMVFAGRLLRFVSATETKLGKQRGGLIAGAMLTARGNAQGAGGGDLSTNDLLKAVQVATGGTAASVSAVRNKLDEAIDGYSKLQKALLDDAAKSGGEKSDKAKAERNQKAEKAECERLKILSANVTNAESIASIVGYASARGFA